MGWIERLIGIFKPKSKDATHIPADHSTGRGGLIDLFNRKLPTELKDEVYSYLWADTISTDDYLLLVESKRRRRYVPDSSSHHTIPLPGFTRIALVGRDFAQGAVAWYYNNQDFSVTFDQFLELPLQASSFLLTDIFDVGITPSSSRLRRLTFEYSDKYGRRFAKVWDTDYSFYCLYRTLFLNLLPGMEKLLKTYLWQHTKLEFVFSRAESKYLLEYSPFEFISISSWAIKLWPAIKRIQGTKDLPIDIIYKHRCIGDVDLVPLLELNPAVRLDIFYTHCMNIARRKNPISLCIAVNLLRELLDAINDDSIDFTIDEFCRYVSERHYISLDNHRRSDSLDWENFMIRFDVAIKDAQSTTVPPISSELAWIIEDAARSMMDVDIKIV